MIYSIGDIYEGYWLAGKFSGQGRLISFNGPVYEGQWLRGEKNGFGILKQSDGSVYRGQVKSDKPE